MTGATGVQIVLVGGHESDDARDLERFEPLVDGARTTVAGRALHNIVSAALDHGDPVVVLPMTFGRDPAMVADAAKTLRWLNRTHAGRIALTAPFGQIDHLTAWLRTAANRASLVDPASALLIVAPHSNPFDEAELHRVGYLVATHGALDEVAVAIADDGAQLSAAAARLRRLGATRIVAVPAGFAASLPAADVEFGGPVMSDASIVRVIGTRVRDALAALDAGDDGIDTGLLADHGHGYAHSHAFEGEAHTHPHPHDHADGTRHSHTHGGLHAHAHHPHDSDALALSDAHHDHDH